MKKLIRILLLIIAFCYPANNDAVAHQPRIVAGDSATLVEAPEISKAYYGQLTGKPNLFVVDAPGNWELFVEILVPNLIEARKDKSFRIEVEDNGKKHLVAQGSGSTVSWTPFYEEFGGDNYFRGPSFRANAGPGKYTITVFSPNNTGKYVLVIGERESFTPSEILRTIAVLPKLKSDFFNRSPMTAYFNRTGLFLLLMILLASAILSAAVYVARRILTKTGRRL
jgi:hypothetical protein